jgi:hypothetical protein
VNPPDNDAQGTQWGHKYSWCKGICCKVGQLSNHHGKEPCPPYGLSQIPESAGTYTQRHHIRHSVRQPKGWLFAKTLSQQAPHSKPCCAQQLASACSNQKHTCSQARGTCRSQTFLLDDKAASYEYAAADSKGQAYVLLSHG